jgi:hypothetical protein
LNLSKALHSEAFQKAQDFEGKKVSFAYKSLHVVLHSKGGFKGSSQMSVKYQSSF